MIMKKPNFFISIGYFSVNVTNLTPDPDYKGAARPWISRIGDQLLYTYDRDIEASVVEITLNLDAFGLDPSDPDTGVYPNSIVRGDDDTGDDSDDKNRCGCATTTPAGSALGLAGVVVLGAALRRRYRRA